MEPHVVCATEAETGLPTSQFGFSCSSEASYNEMAPPSKVFSFHLASLLQVFSKTVGFRSSLTLRPYITSHTTPKWFHYTVKYGAIARPLPPPNHPHTCSCTPPLPALSPTACTLMAAFDAAHSHPTQYTYTFVQV